MNKILKSGYIVRFSDCDPFGHLNNSRYIDYFLNAREDHLRQSYELTIDTYHKQGYGWVIGSHEIVYLKPAKYNEKISVQSQLLEVTDHYLLAEMIMTDEHEQQLKAVLWTKFVFINLKTAKKDIHPEELKSFLASLVTGAYGNGISIRERIAALQAEIALNA